MAQMKEQIKTPEKELNKTEMSILSDVQVQEAQRVPNNMDANKPNPRHIIIKMPKVEDKKRI